MSLASFSSNLIASLTYFLLQSTLDTSVQSPLQKSKLSAQELLHNNQYTFRT